MVKTVNSSDAIRKSPKSRWIWVTLASAFVMMILAVILFGVFLMTAPLWMTFSCVDGDSMEQTLSSDDLVLTLKNAEYDRGDIVVFHYNEHEMIKRVIAVEGDRIEVDPVSNCVILNGEVLEEPYLTFSEQIPGTDGVVVVPPDHVFVMGDHRNSSLDSRKIGCIHEDALDGKLVFRIWPLDRIGAI